MNKVCGIVIAAAVPAAGVLLAAGCSRPRVEAATATAPVVAVARVTRGDIAQTLTVTAEFRPYQEIEVHPKVAGYVQSIPVDVGDRVTAGQLLCQLESPELVDQAAQDEAAVKRAEADIDRAKADLARAQSEHDVAHLNATRLSDVRKAQPHLVAQQDIDDAVGRDRADEAQVATTQAALIEAEDQLDAAKANEEKTNALVAYMRITAPFAGVVTKRYADTGAMVQAGTSSDTQAMPIVRLSENGRLRLVIPVPESAVARIHVGTPVVLNVAALGKTFQGTVSRFSDQLDPDTRTMHVEVDVRNPTLEIVPGMYADASIVLDEVKNATVASIEAIDRTGTAPAVFKIDRDGRVVPQPVTIGLTANNRVQVTAGLTPGDLVVVGNRAQLKPGETVVPKVVESVLASGAQ